MKVVLYKGLLVLLPFHIKCNLKTDIERKKSRLMHFYGGILHFSPWDDVVWLYFVAVALIMEVLLIFSILVFLHHFLAWLIVEKKGKNWIGSLLVKTNADRQSPTASPTHYNCNCDAVYTLYIAFTPSLLSWNSLSFLLLYKECPLSAGVRCILKLEEVRRMWSLSLAVGQRDSRSVYGCLWIKEGDQIYKNECHLTGKAAAC